MQVINAIGEILKKEGVERPIGYPVNPIIEGAAEEDIRTIMVWQDASASICATRSPRPPRATRSASS